jgi:hypothetical protein
MMGGAAALAVAATGGISPAAASVAGDGPTSTADHARRVLEFVDVDLGLVDPDGAQRRMQESLATYEASDPRDREADDLYAWIRQRIADLVGAGSSEAAVTEIPQTRALLAFAFLVYTQHQDVRPPTITRSMPVPTVLARLEPDFFPELLSQIDAKGKRSPAFAGALQAGAAGLDRLVATVSNGPAISTGSAAAAASTNPTGTDILNGTLAVLLVMVAYYSIKKKVS